jgi:curli biogenesis system outer membrane secretion channel CsgG
MKSSAKTSRFGSWRVWVVLLLLLCGLEAGAQRKKRIAVLNFETGADAKQTAQSLGEKDDLGLTLANLLMNEVAGSAKVQVVERAAMDKIIHEQNLSNTDRMDPATAARIGKIAGVDAVLIGSVAQFEGSSKESAVTKVAGLANLGFGTGGKNQAHRMQTKVDIVLTGRLVDVNTGVVLVTAQGSGSAEHAELRTTSEVSGQQTGGSPVLNEATMKAIQTLAAKLDASPAMNETVAVARTAYKGPVADADANTLILAISSKEGARVGDVVQISRVGRTVKDKSGAVLKVLYEPLGTAKITDVDEKSATATFSGSKPARVDDVATFTP